MNVVVKREVSQSNKDDNNESS